MRRANESRTIRKSFVFLGGVLLSGLCSSGQETPSTAPPSAAAGQTADLRALTQSIADLQAQMKSMSAQMEEMQKEQARSQAEAQELRRKLEEAHQSLSPSSNSNGGYAPATKATQAPPSTSVTPRETPATANDQSGGDRLAAIEETQQLQDSKINDIYQTKIESGSKYRLRLSGIVLLNMFANRGIVDNQDIPELADSQNVSYSKGTFGGSLRQSQIGLEAFGPDVLGAHTSADIKFDFAGGFPQTSYGTSTGYVRLRTGTVRMDWGDTAIVVGQDYLFFAPLAPTSLATLAIPALSYNGNLWSWTPQVRVEHTVHVGDSAQILLQAGILDSLSGDPPLATYQRTATYGESSGQPAYAARIAWKQRAFGRDLTLGFGGYYGRQTWGFGRNVNGWAGTADLSVPLGKYFEFSGEFYRGSAVGGIGGAVGQTVLLSGPIADPATVVRGLDSMGGWAQLKFKPVPKWEINAAFGQDNPFSRELSLDPYTPVYADPVERNRSALVNVIYHIKSDFLFSAEYQRLRTIEIGSQNYNANHVSLSLGYIF
jgi:hypothetical protein